MRYGIFLVAMAVCGLEAAAEPAVPSPADEVLLEKPVPRESLEKRGRSDHPCVSLTAADVSAAKERIERYDWARAERDKILTEADKWLQQSDEHWLAFLPKPGACYAYGFTGCPICDGKTGTWAAANCSWDNPGHVRCANGHVLPDAEHPDNGEGYKAPDGRIHYFVGQFNAWATEQWTLNALPSLTQAYALTGDQRYAERAALLLDALASIYAESTSGSWDYPSTPPSGRFARPWYQVARTLVHYVDQYDLLYGNPALEEPSLRRNMNRRDNIERYLLEDGAYYCYDHSFSGGLHNGHADYLRGALAVGCLLDMPEYVRAAVDGPYSIKTMLSNNIDRDGRYYETAPGYAIHARLLYLTFADPLRNLRNAEYPSGLNLYDDPKFVSCMLLPERQLMLAGRLPNFGDSGPDVKYRDPSETAFSETDYHFLERLYAKASDESKRAEFGAALKWLAEGKLDEHRSRAKARNWLLWHAAPAPAPEATLSPSLKARVEGSWIAGMKGLGLLRDGRQSALVRFGPSLNHGDPDDLGLLYYADGYEWTYDIGYGLGSTHCHVGWGSSTVSHCLVTVNEVNQLRENGTGGSLLAFATLPQVKMVEAASENSYSAEGVSEYRRTVALVDGLYTLDVFRVAGGRQHDFGFGSIGDSLSPEGVPQLEPREGSLAEGVAWGQLIGADGDIKGYPNKPYWNPPPGNGYGFFYNVRRGQPEGVWGGTWSIEGDHPARFRMLTGGDPAEAVFATAPGLYPHLPLSSYAIARRSGDNLRSTFISTYESFATDREPQVRQLERIGDKALQVRRSDGRVDVLLFGEGPAASAYGALEFQGRFAYLSGDAHALDRIQTLGCSSLRIVDRSLETQPGTFDATVTEVDFTTRAVVLDKDVPAGLEGLTSVFSNPAYSRTSAYPVASAEGRRMVLQTSALELGVGRAAGLPDAQTVVSDIPHEYARPVSRGKSSRFFDGKWIRAEKGGRARISATEAGDRLTLHVDDATKLSPGERFVYEDIAPGDRLHIDIPRVHSLP